MIDPVGSLIATLRAVPIASKRVRGGEPEEGDALGPGQYQRFVVLVRLGRRLLPQVPVQEVRVGYRAYGVTYQDAAALSGEIATALHLAGGRSASSGWIYQSIEETGGAATADPDTHQPYESGVISLLATT